MGKPSLEGTADIWESTDWLADDLFEDETILWADRPRSSRWAVLRAVPVAFIGLLILAIGLFLVLRMLRTGSFDAADRFPAPLHMRILVAACLGAWVIPCCLLVMAYPLFVHRRMANTYYTLTNIRAIVVEPDFLGRPRVTSFWPPQLRQMRRLDRPDATGDLVFVYDPKQIYDGGLGFVGIGNAHVVERLIWRSVEGMVPLADPRPGRST